MQRAPTGLELKEVMRQHGTNAAGREPPLAPFAPPEFCRCAEPGDGFDDGRRRGGDADTKAPAGQLAAADVRVLEPPRRQ